MSYFFLVPALICLFFVMNESTGGVDTAFLSVYLPTLLLLPWDYTLRVPHLPELSVSQICVIPLGMVALSRLVRRGSFVLMDFLVPAFLISLTISEVLGEKVTKDGILFAVAQFISLLLPYAIGRTLIEPGNRIVVVRRIVLLVLLLGVPGLFEWRMGRNFYAPIGDVFGVVMSPTIQLRGGRGRFATSFEDAEVAGIAVAMVFALNAWLAFLWRTRTWQDPADALFTFLQKYHIAEILLVAYIYLTQSRGPELALVAGYLILQIPRFKNMKLATVAVAALLAVGAAGAYQYFSEQTNVTDINAIHDEQQGSAYYRRQMLELFKPIVERGGWLGWGYMSFPHAQGLGNLGNGVQSVDNQFLYVQLGQGKLGYFLFILIAVESVRTAFMRTWRLQSLPDRAFAVCMLSALVMLWITLTTVYMGSQLPQVSFLLIGWAQSIVKSKPQVAAEEPVTHPAFFFRRVFT
jgi:O-Antigen ligase